MENCDGYSQEREAKTRSSTSKRIEKSQIPCTKQVLNGLKNWIGGETVGKRRVQSEKYGSKGDLTMGKQRRRKGRFRRRESKSAAEINAKEKDLVK